MPTIQNPYAPGGAKAPAALDGYATGVRSAAENGIGAGPIPTGSVTGTMTNAASSSKAAQNAAAGYTSSSSSGSAGSSSGSQPSSLIDADQALQILNNAGTTAATSDNPNSLLPYSASPDSGLLLSPPLTVGDG